MTASGYADPRQAAFAELKEAERIRRADRSGIQHLLRSAVHAQVNSEKLTRATEWHQFQQLIQGAINEAREKRAKIGPRLMDPGVTGHAELLSIKHEGMVLTERIETLEMVLAIPLEIESHGADARKVLEEAKWLTEE